MEINSINVNPLSLNWNYKTGSCATLLVALSAIGVVAGIFALAGTNNLAFMANFPSLGTNGSVALLGGSCCGLALGIIWSFSLLHNRHKKGKIPQEGQGIPKAPDPSEPSPQISPQNLPAALPTPNVQGPSSSSSLQSSQGSSTEDVPEAVLPPLPAAPLPIPADLEPFLEAIKTALLDPEHGTWGKGHEYHLLLLRCGVHSHAFLRELKEQGALTPEAIENSENWEQVKQKLAKLFAQTAAYVADKPRLRWLHGTRSPTLIGIDRVAREDFSEGRHLLVPTGTLVAHNIVPLTGELCMGIGQNGGNQQNLSGVRATHVESAARYANSVDFCFNPEYEKKFIEDFVEKHAFLGVVRLKIAVLRLLLSPETTREEKEWIKGKLDEILLTAEYSKEVVSTWKQYAHLLGTPFRAEESEEEQQPPLGEAVGVPRSSGPAIWGIIIDKNESAGRFHLLLENGATKWIPFNDCKKPAPTLPHPEIVASQETLSSLEQRINPRQVLRELRDLCDSAEPWILSEEEKSYLTDSFPILLGTRKLQKERYLRGFRSDVAGERVVRGSVALEEDVTSAFTKKKDLPRLGRWLEQRSLAIYPMTISAAYFLAAYGLYQSQTA